MSWQETSLFNCSSYCCPRPTVCEQASKYPSSPWEISIRDQQVLQSLVLSRRASAHDLTFPGSLARAQSNQGPSGFACRRRGIGWSSARRLPDGSIVVRASLSRSRSNAAAGRRSSVLETRALFGLCLTPAWTFIWRMQIYKTVSEKEILSLPKCPNAGVRSIFIRIAITFKWSPCFIHSFFNKIVADFSGRMFVKDWVHECNFCGASSRFSLCWAILNERKKVKLPAVHLSVSVKTCLIKLSF